VLSKIIQKFQKSRKLFLNSDRKLPKHLFINTMPIEDEDGWQKIAPLGEFETHPLGGYEITPDDVTSMYANWARTKLPILIDVDHNSLWGNTEAVGWVPELKAEDDGLYMKAPEWVGVFEEKIKNHAFRYFSPVFNFKAKDKRGRKIGTKLVSIAVTNMPYLDEEIDPIKNTNSQEDFEMKLTPEEKATLIKNYGLAADVSDEDLQAAIIKNSTPPPDPPKSKFKEDERAELIKNHNLAAEATDAEIDAAVAAAEAIRNSAGGDKPPAWATGLISEVKGLKGDIDTNKAATLKANAEALVDDAVRNFKIRTADREIFLNQAIADFDKVKTDLDGRVKNSVLGTGIKEPVEKVAEAGKPISNAEARANFIENARIKNLTMAS